MSGPAPIPSMPRTSSLGRDVAPSRATSHGISWPAAIASFLVPLLLVAGVLAWQRFGDPPRFAITLTDQYTGAPLAGALLTVDGAPLAVDQQGTIVVPPGEAPLAIEATAPGYAPFAGTVDPAGAEAWTLTLRPSVLSGRLTDAASGAPIAGAAVAARGADGQGPATVSGADGAYLLENVPEVATLLIDAGDFGIVENPVGQQTTADFALRKTLVTGFVRDPDGNPVAGARVGSPDGALTTVTGPDGGYRLANGASAPELLVTASGYDDAMVSVPESLVADAVLEPTLIRSIYAPASMLSDPADLDELIALANRTEINAIVIDAKEYNIFYDTQVEFFRNVPDMVLPIYDPAEIVRKLDEAGIYSIARMVVFKDPLVAEAYPHLDVLNENTGEAWRDYNGAAWVNAFNQELWVANAEFAAELARFGFDEVQYDYIRFPSDGDLTQAEFGNDYTEELRRAAITGAVQMGADAVRAAGAKFSLDLFPVIAIYGNDQGIGQTLQDLAPIADYVSLMIYPSHYERGNIPVDGHPNDFPAETVTYTLEMAEKLVPGTKKKMRPWLQDFDYPLEGYRDYGPADVRAQIDAAEEFGASGWILWNAAGVFEEAALKPAG